MRILFSNYAMLDREGFRRSFSLAREMAALGNDVTFLTTLPFYKFSFPYKKINRDGVKILAFPDIVPNSMRRTGFGPLTFILKTLYIFFRKYDIYHSDVGHRISSGIPILFKSIFFKITYISEWYNYLGKGGQYDSKKGLKKYTHGLYDLLLEIPEKKRADGIVCLSTAMSYRIENEGIKDKQVCVIHGGADVSTIEFSPIPKYRSKHGLPSSSLVFGFIGLDERSGVGAIEEIRPFIDALNELAAESKLLQNTCLLTTGWHLPEHYKKDLAINFQIREFGWLDYRKYCEVLNCVDAFVLLQKVTLDNAIGWPNRLGDYIASGRKTITNPYGDLEIVANKFEELFIRVSYDKESIKEKLIEFVGGGKIYTDREIIRDIALNKLSWHQKGKELVSFYNNVLSSKLNHTEELQ